MRSMRPEVMCYYETITQTGITCKKLKIQKKIKENLKNYWIGNPFWSRTQLGNTDNRLDENLIAFGFYQRKKKKKVRFIIIITFI